MKTTFVAKTMSGIRTNMKCSTIIAVRSVMISTIATTGLTVLVWDGSEMRQDVTEL